MHEFADSVRTLGSVFTMSIAVIIQLLLLVIALVVIRAKRPDATWPFVVVAILGMLHCIIAPLSVYLLFRFGPEWWEIETVIMINSGFQVVRSLFNAGVWGLLIYGIVRLAKPAPNTATGEGRAQ